MSGAMLLVGLVEAMALLQLWLILIIMCLKASAVKCRRASVRACSESYCKSSWGIKESRRWRQFMSTVGS